MNIKLNKSRARLNSYRDLSTVLITIIALNIIGVFYFFRVDLTFDKRFSLSPTTKQTVEQLEDNLFIKVYLDGDLPVSYKLLRNSTKEILNELRAYNKRINYTFVNPSESDNKQERNKMYKQLASEGLAYYNIPSENKDGVSYKTIFPSASITYKDRTIPINLLVSNTRVPTEVDLNNSVQKLELNLMNAMYKLTNATLPLIGFTEGHAEYDEMHVGDIAYELSKTYNVVRVPLIENLDALTRRVNKDSNTTMLVPRYDVLIVAKPDSAFNDKSKFILDQYITHGGKVIWLVDQIRASMDSLYKSRSTMALESGLKLEDLFFSYGVRINNNLILNRNALEIGTAEGELRAWDYFPLALPVKNHIITENLEAIKTHFVSNIDTIGRKGIKKTVLLTTDNYSRLAPSPVIIDIFDILYRRPNPALYNYPPQNIAVLLEGKFESAYKYRPVDPRIAFNKDFDIKYESPENKMIVISDGDLIGNQIIEQQSGIFPLPLGYDRYTQKFFDNKKFIQNAVNYLVGDENMIKLRNKEFKIRLLDKNKVTESKLFYQLLNTVLPPFLIVIFGFAIFFIKKFRYMRKY